MSVASSKTPVCVREIDHVVLRCHDQAQMLAFYTEVLGLVEERRIDDIGLVQLRAGRGMIDLVPGAPSGFDGANMDHVCLVIAPGTLGDVVRFLADRGVEVVGEPMERYGAGGYGLSIYVRDPEGNIVELKVANHVG